MDSWSVYGASGGGGGVQADDRHVPGSPVHPMEVVSLDRRAGDGCSLCDSAVVAAGSRAGRSGRAASAGIASVRAVVGDALPAARDRTRGAHGDHSLGGGPSWAPYPRAHAAARAVALCAVALGSGVRAPRSADRSGPHWLVARGAHRHAAARVTTA